MDPVVHNRSHASYADEFVKMYEETGRKVVEAAQMELETPTIADAFGRCVEQGATRIIISPYFLCPGRHWDKYFYDVLAECGQHIPALAAEAAKKHPHVSYIARLQVD